MKIFFEILVVWQENDLVFSSNSKKIALQKQHKKAPFSLYTHTDNEIQHDKVSISWQQGKGTQIFYKTIKEFLAIRRAISLNKDVRFIMLTTGETRHIQQIYIDEPSMHHCPKFVYLKRVFLHACNNSTSY